MTLKVVAVLFAKVREERITSAAVDMQVQIKLRIDACLDVQTKTMEY